MATLKALLMFAVLALAAAIGLAGCSETEDQLAIKGLGPQTPCQMAVARGETWACNELME